MSSEAIRGKHLLRGLSGLCAAGALALGGAVYAHDKGQAATDASKASAGTQSASAMSEDARITGKLHRVNGMEISAGKLAQDKGSSKAVKDYGARLVRDHEAADKKITSYAGKAGIDLAASPSPSDAADEQADHQKMDDLGNLQGAEFDRKFASTMQEGHAKVIAAVTEARDRVTDAKLKNLLNDLLPTLRKHERIATDIVNTMQHRASR